MVDNKVLNMQKKKKTPHKYVQPGSTDQLFNPHFKLGTVERCCNVRLLLTFDLLDKI